MVEQERVGKDSKLSDIEGTNICVKNTTISPIKKRSRPDWKTPRRSEMTLKRKGRKLSSQIRNTYRPSLRRWETRWGLIELLLQKK